jgi:hypothetical protein
MRDAALCAAERLRAVPPAGIRQMDVIEFAAGEAGGRVVKPSAVVPFVQDCYNSASGGKGLRNTGYRD